VGRATRFTSAPEIRDDVGARLRVVNLEEHLGSGKERARMVSQRSSVASSQVIPDCFTAAE
jgi:hypothetical protein